MHQLKQPVDLIHHLFPVFRLTINRWICTSANSLLWAQIAYRSDTSPLPCVQTYHEALDMHECKQPVDQIITSSLCSGQTRRTGYAWVQTACYELKHPIDLMHPIPCVQAYNETVDVHKHEHPIDLMYPFFPTFRPTMKQWMCTSTNTL